MAKEVISARAVFVPLDADTFLAAADVGSGRPAVSIGQSTAVDVVRNDPVVAGFANRTSKAGDVACGDPELTTSEGLGGTYCNGSDGGQCELHFLRWDKCLRRNLYGDDSEIEWKQTHLKVGISRVIYTSGYSFALRPAMANIANNILSSWSNTQNTYPKFRTIVLHAQHLHVAGCVAWMDRHNVCKDLQCCEVKNADIKEVADLAHSMIHVGYMF